MNLRGDGFSMMEILVVIAIVAILATLAVPSYLDKIVRDQIVEALPLADIAKNPLATPSSSCHGPERRRCRSIPCPPLPPSSSAKDMGTLARSGGRRARSPSACRSAGCPSHRHEP